jgi:hypothetical protein
MTMAKIWVSVSFPVRIEVDFDCSRIMDDDYIEEMQDKAKDIAVDILKSEKPFPIIHDSEIPALIE